MSIEEIIKTIPFMLNQQALQCLMDALWSYGIRPSKTDSLYFRDDITSIHKDKNYTVWLGDE